MRLLFIVDPLDLLALAGDTSYALMLEAEARGDEVWTCQVEHLGLESATAVTSAVRTRVVAADTPRAAFTIGDRQRFELAQFDAALMRKDPPLDVNYLHATWILDHARGQTVLVNDPRGLRELNEHLAVLRFPELTPTTICTRSAARLQEFLREQGGAIVVKPVDGFGGLGIFLVREGDPNASSIFETSTGAGTRWTLAQRYLPAAVEGDKRILMVDGEPVGAVLRVPAAAEARGNLHVGGRAVKTTVDEADRRIIAAISPLLRKYGQILVGIDVIGGMLTEINITSPTGVRHISRLDERNAAAPILEAIERLSKTPGKGAAEG
jgi:glutathione synthase